MINFKCKMCGGSLDVSAGQTVAKCAYCGTTQTLPVFDDEKKTAYYNRANALRMMCEFDKAAGIYEIIVTEFSGEAEAYWGLVLCKYGVEYIDDPKTGVKVPTCHRTLLTSVFDDPDYKNAIRCADAASDVVYREEARAIDNIQTAILEISSREEPYDIFLCYKESDAYGNRTEDSVLAFEIYTGLTEKGYRVFYSKISLEDKLGKEYEPYIFAALSSAKLMIMVTTSKENCEAVWVANEWKRYLSLMKNDKDKTIISCFKGISAGELPGELKTIQGLDLSKLGAMQDLLRGVEKIVGKTDAASFSSTPAYQTEGDKEDTFDILEAGYRKYVHELAELDSFCTYASDLEPIIAFFESAGEYKESKRYLETAKFEYAKRVHSYRESVQALIYLDDIPHFVGVDALIEDCKAKLIKYRTQDLQNKGYAVPFGDEITSRCFCSVISALRDTEKREEVGDEELDELDRVLIQDCRDKGIAFINRCGLKIIENESDKQELSKIEHLLPCLEEYPIPGLDAMKKQLRAKLDAIEKKERAVVRNKTIRKIAILSSVAAVVLAVILIIVFSVNAKINGYAADHFTVQVVSKTNEKHNDTGTLVTSESGYSYIFEFVISNAGPHMMTKMKGYMDINNAQGRTLSTVSVDMRGNLESGQQETWNIRVRVEEGDDGAEIWNSDLSALEITFRITYITFEDGTMKYYSDTKNEVVHPISSTGTNGKDLADDSPNSSPEPETVQVGDIITFGKYELDADWNNGYEDLRWIVVKKEGNAVLLLSEYALISMAYGENDAADYVSWADSGIRTYLNETFYHNSFSDAEKAKIMSTRLVPTDEEKTLGAADTQDRIFIPSWQELCEYFYASAEMCCYQTGNIWSPWSDDGIGGISLDNHHTYCDYWLRECIPSYQYGFPGQTVFVYPYGADATTDFQSSNAVRPMMWVTL